MKFIFDTGAITQYFANNNQVVELMTAVKNGKNVGIIPKPILVEIFYKICQKEGKEVAKIRITSLLQTKFLKISNISDATVFEAGKTKCQYNVASLADSFAVAQSLLMKGILVTTDGELAKIQGVKIQKIDF